MYNRHKVTEGQRIGEMKYWISYKHNKNGQIRFSPHNLSRTASFLHTAHAEKVYRAMTPWYDKFNDDDIIEHRFIVIVSLLNRHASPCCISISVSSTCCRTILRHGIITIALSRHSHRIVVAPSTQTTTVRWCDIELGGHIRIP